MHELSTQRYIGPYKFAVVYAGLGDANAAFEWFNRAYDARSYLLVEYLNTHSASMAFTTTRASAS